ncbi:MAG: exopolysaccharide biosynthesis polyprenyl glycosylphosphotransferase [Ruminococcaceae bacterium]|nr:exopolysaccharide biosynthesis polyprenyl glycosylphosphotransferase [Oscillospiraceae bacterium]
MQERTKKNKDQYKKTLNFIATVVLVAVYTGIFAYMWFSYYNNKEIAWGFHTRGNWLLLAIYVILIIIISRVYNAFAVNLKKAGDVIYSQALSMACVNVITYFQISLLAREMLNVIPFVIMMVADLLFVSLWTLAFHKLFKKLYPPHNLLMVYGSRLVESFSKKVAARKDRYRIGRFMHISEGVEEICKVIPEYEGVVICDVTSKERNRILKYCFEKSIRSYTVPKISDILIRGAEDIHMFDSPLLLNRNIGLTFGERLLKRLLDLVIVIPITIVALPFMGITALFIKLYDGGPVIYKQERLTEGGKTFNVYKFRSMIVDAEKDGKARLAAEKDDRITPVGKIIRKIRMDELPQLFNILFGQMSFVGPRPERPSIADEYQKEMPEFKYRTKVKAGLTGYAQVLGKYNTTPYDKLKLDLTYITNYSILLDIKLIFMTVKILFESESTEGFEDNSIPSAGGVETQKEEKTESDDRNE